MKANSDDVNVSRAILRGLEKRHKKLQDRPVVMHTVSNHICARIEPMLTICDAVRNR